MSRQRAIALEDTDPLSVLLQQISGPAHIAWSDARWQEFLCGYDVWVHVEDISPTVRLSLLKNAPRSSNLAALCGHVTQMLLDFVSTTTAKDSQDDQVEAFSNRISLMAKARATCGALTILRLLAHVVLAEHPSEYAYIQEVFTYQSREEGTSRPAGADLWSALCVFLAAQPDLSVPEVYDTVVAVLNLQVVLLSTQLYQPMISSFQQASSQPRSLFLDALFSSPPDTGLLQSLLLWQLQAPKPPERSIAFHHALLKSSLVTERLGADGMYESHHVVHARAPTANEVVNTTMQPHHQNADKKHNLLLDATKGVWVLSSSLILLPFRLVSLALGLWGHKDKYDQTHKEHMKAALKPSRTKDVLWLTHSPVGDLAVSLMMLLINNHRANDRNGYRQLWKGMVDSRWDDLPDLPDPHRPHDLTQTAPKTPTLVSITKESMTVNFQALFDSFGRMTHTELGALWLYTVLQASPSFSEAVAVRSDMDTIVLPLLRTLYFSSSSRLYAAADFSKNASKLSIRQCPFRSPSQLYVISILLLLFSQDSSFGSDAFRRVMIPKLLWYKERPLRDISLGSVLLLSILRALTFNLNRMQDSFLLSNLCAVLMNLSHSIVDLHDYTAMRLVAVTLSSMKRYSTLVTEHPEDDEEDLSTPRAMHGEVVRALLHVVKSCLAAKTIERNLQLVYAIVYNQVELRKVLADKTSAFKKSEVSRLQMVLDEALKILESAGDTRSAPKAIKAMEQDIARLQSVTGEKKKKRENQDDFTFTYEEEADPETFFVPYVWEVVVCCVSAGSLEWEKDRIRVFPLLDDDYVPDSKEVMDKPDKQAFAKDVSDVV